MNVRCCESGIGFMLGQVLQRKMLAVEVNLTAGILCFCHISEYSHLLYIFIVTHLSLFVNII